MANPHAPLPLVSTTAGTWSVWLALGSFLVGFVLRTVWNLFILFPQWKLVGGEPDPAYLAQYDVGNALFSVAGIVLAIAAVASGIISIGEAKPFPPGEVGRKAALVRGWIGICLGGLFLLFSLMATIG